LYGLSDIVVSDCPLLYDIQLMLSELHIVSIDQCPQLSLIFDGSNLTKMDINDCGAIIPLNSKENAQISIFNATLLDDFISEAPAYNLNKRIEYLLHAALIIMRRLHTYTTRIKFIKFKKLVKEDMRECPICQEILYPCTTCFTRCGHAFHQDCLSRWLNIRRSCPLCNGQL